ncbi:MAG: tRNA 4-thiouridine(8) synthase ThiI [Firmicutes bacterium]|nr:tRNA 4-thiouridine(8) synthase ThiI [Bacillota bacterium]
MKQVIIIRYSEIHLKGDNRSFFENLLAQNIKRVLTGFMYTLNKISGRYIITDYITADEPQLLMQLQLVFGIHSLSPGFQVKTKVDDIKAIVSKLNISGETFKVVTRRADKSFAIGSMEFSAELGGVVLRNNKDVKVDVNNPAVIINVDIREDGFTYISTVTTPGANGMPSGSSGKGLLLLSGGIDSPVAGYCMAKRGMSLNALHFYSFPYTSKQALEKVKTLAKRLSEFSGEINLYTVPFTFVQEQINKNCNKDYMIIVMRRIMMRIAEKLAAKNGCGAIISGESLGQVASQTLESITVTNALVRSMPIFRPLIGSDKQEIMDTARKIGTYDTSILPYEDCCTVFLPKNPVTRPNLDRVEKEESKLNIAELVDICVSKAEHEIIN